ncbi:fumarylacetoacetase [Acinetobacter ursingii]|uniref:fumarylacetoacetase n=1 Tax=Acinetobacter ursingii TaxID=108980 RepID=UPI003AF79828
MNTALHSFIPVPEQSDFSIHNLPYGVFSLTPQGERHIGVAIGDWVLDLAVLEQAGILVIDAQQSYFNQPSLNAFIATGQAQWKKTRRELQHLLTSTESPLYRDAQLRAKALIAQADVILHLPVEISGYTDFYSSKEHATNVGCMFRDPKNALLPNWSELPVGYNGRASSVVVSGTDVVRPSGQIKLPDQTRPIFSASRKLDFELETAFIVGKSTALGQPIAIENAWDHIFGMVLLNDWSARDIQQWEYVPLGPFNAKTFASSISPWVVTMEALQPFRVNGPVQQPQPLAYLQENSLDGMTQSYDLHLSVEIQTPNSLQPEVICQTNFKHMYWTMAQQLTHHTIGGCNVNVGDLMGSGTISGPTPNSYGSLLELTWNTTQPIQLKNGQQRGFLHDGDRVIMKGYAEKDGIRVGFGEVHNQILPALNFDFAVTQVQHEAV